MGTAAFDRWARSLSLLVIVVPTLAFAQTAKQFDPPGKTNWSPQGCRTVSFDDAVLPSRESWRNLHGDPMNTDEISRAIGPVIAQEWIAETATYNTTGPVLDRAGNLYFSPFSPFENVVLISLDPTDGSRRWSIPGTGAEPGSAPMILDDPDNPGEQIVYLALYDRALAVRRDGTLVWDVTTGLTLGPDPLVETVLGVNYLPTLDAIVAATIDGFIYVLDRTTGGQLLAAPFSLPGEKSPDLPSAVPPSVVDAAEDAWQLLVNRPDGKFAGFVNVLLGEDVEVGNMFSIDPMTGRLWVAATAPDAEDGTVDGLSELGALYGLDVVPDGGSFQIVEACHASFQGGTGSTPALRADGSRIYVGDNFGKLLTISATDCDTIWEVNLGQQIIGSVAVSSDNDVVYAASRDFITQVFDQGSVGVPGWEAGLAGLFNDLQPGQTEFNLNLTSIGANGLGFQAGAGLILGDVPFALTVGVGVLDRETGEARYFTSAPEETVAVMTTAADGGFYLGNSPVRRALAIGFGLSTDPLIGGITKFGVQRHDLLMRDAACAAEARALNAAANVGVCLDSAEADAVQLRELIAQMRDDAAPQALAKTEIGPASWGRIEALLSDTDQALTDFEGGASTAMGDAALPLGRACAFFDPCPETPRLDCRKGQKSKLQLKQKDAVRDKLLWKLIKGDSTGQSDFGDPLTTADHSLCIYAGSTQSLVGEVTVPADNLLWKAISDKGFKYKDRLVGEDGAKVIVLKGSDQSKTKVMVRGKGERLPDPQLPLELPVTAQVLNTETDVCFDATYDTVDVIKNDEARFKAKKLGSPSAVLRENP